MKCRICDSCAPHKIITLVEKMFGTGDKFDYFQCGDCGCLQIVKIPDKLENYYPSNYYSMNLPDFKKKNTIMSWLNARRLDQDLGNTTLIGRLLKYLKGPSWFNDSIRNNLPLSADLRILDVGSGQGKRLREWRRVGFTNLTGIDPFVDKSITYADGVTILKEELPAHKGVYDLVFSSHSLEHMWDQTSMLTEMFRLTRPGGYIMVEIPIMSDYCWKNYGINWFCLDAPRHFYIHTLESFRKLISKIGGVKILAEVHKSIPLNFWASELYLRNIPFANEQYDQASIGENSTFTPADIESFKRISSKINQSKDGGDVRFYLQKTG